MNKVKLLTTVFLGAIMAAGVGFSMSPSAYAVGERVDSEVREARVTERRCTVAQARLGAAKTRYENIEERRTNTYAGLTERVDSLIASAEDSGYDVSDLNEARSAVQADIDAYKTQTQELYSALSETEQLACEESETPYLDSLGEARVELRDVRQAALTVETTFREQVLPELKELGVWAKEQQ